MAGFEAKVGAGIDVREADLERALGAKPLRKLLGEFEHRNPDHGKRRSMGYSTYNVPKRIKTWERVGDLIRFPRGGAERIREAARLSRSRVVFRDQRLRLPEVEFPEHRLELRWYQRDALAACAAKEQGIVRAPTGSGKTTIAIAFAAAVRQPALVVVRKRGLLVQWLRRLERELGIDPREVGQIGGGKRRVGPRFTLALQQSLSSERFPLADFASRFGTVLVDECHEVAASLFQRAVCAFPARYRIGFSADECVARGTIIAMGDGSVLPVEDVRSGDLVLTPLGPRRVVAAMFKGFRETGRISWDEGSLRCTGETWFAGPLGWHVPHEVSSVRLRKSKREDRRRNRWFKPPGEEGCGRTARLEVGSIGVAGSSPTVDLRSLRASIEGHRDLDASVEWDGLTVPVFDLDVDGAACYYANGALVHNTRKDRKEFLVYDQLGEVLLEVSREELEKDGSIVPVVIRIVETNFEADWYTDAPKEDRDFGALLDEMASNAERNDALVAATRSALDVGQRPVLVFTRRRDHARHIADERLFANGIRSGLLLGGPEMKVRFDEDLARLDAGGLDASVGTIEAVGTGTDVPCLRAGVMGLPIGANRQLLNQVCGRICRPDEGKSCGYLYYLLDRRVFPGMASKLHSWTAGRVEAWAGTAWVRADRNGLPRAG